MKRIIFLALACVSWSPLNGAAQSSTYSQIAEADTFVSSGQSNANFGTQSAMEIAAPTAAQPRTEIALIRFNTSALQTAFDSDFGAGNWAVTSVTLTLFSSVATAGQQPNNASFNRIAAGAFEFDLLGNNNWSETGLNWNTLPDLLPGNNNGNTQTLLGTFFWDAAGRSSSTWTLSADSSLFQKIGGGELVTLLGQPTAGSTVGYLFNTRSFNAPLLTVTAAAVPEPAAGSILAGLLCCAGLAKCHRARIR